MAQPQQSGQPPRPEPQGMVTILNTTSMKRTVSFPSPDKATGERDSVAMLRPGKRISFEGGTMGENRQIVPSRTEISAADWAEIKALPHARHLTTRGPRGEQPILIVDAD